MLKRFLPQSARTRRATPLSTFGTFSAVSILYNNLAIYDTIGHSSQTLQYAPKQALQDYGN